MPHRLKDISQQVIVITGASSGIGLCTALKAAEKGARVVLVSRNKGALAEAQRKIEDAGGEAIFVVADVSSREDVNRVVAETISAYGSLDTWVNNAGVSIIGRLEDISEEDSRRLFDTNYWGLVNGSLAAAEHLKGKHGAIINVGSMLSDMAVPLQGMYCASKHAVKGFTDSFRHELEEENSGISVTLIKPAAIATPFFSHAKNYTPHEPKAPPPVYAPEEVAYAILHAAQNPVRDVRVGATSYIMSALNAHSPRLMDWINEKFMFKAQLSNKPKARHKNNLHEAGDDGLVRGKDMPPAIPSIYTRASLHPAVTGAVVAGLGVVAYALLSKRSGPVGKAAFKGLGLLMPLQNALLAKSVSSIFDKRSKFMPHSHMPAPKDITKNVSKIVGKNIKAVNENAKSVKQKTMSFWK